MKNKWYAIAVCLALLSTTGCLELIRRPEAPGATGPARTGESTATETPAGDEAPVPTGNQEPQTKVQKERESAPGPPPPTDPATMAVRRQDPPGAAPLPLAASPERAEQKDIAQINEYALWCIQNGMWKEAKLHLEQALQQDSLVASLHNNLGIVYERFGQDEKAEAAYERARLLNPHKEAYLANIQYFNRRLKALSDTSYANQENMDLDLFEGRRDRSRSFVHTGD